MSTSFSASRDRLLSEIGALQTDILTAIYPHFPKCNAMVEEFLTYLRGIQSNIAAEKESKSRATQFITVVRRFQDDLLWSAEITDLTTFVEQLRKFCYQKLDKDFRAFEKLPDGKPTVHTVLLDIIEKFEDILVEKLEILPPKVSDMTLKVQETLQELKKIGSGWDLEFQDDLGTLLFTRNNISRNSKGGYNLSQVNMKKSTICAVQFLASRALKRARESITIGKNKAHRAELTTTLTDEDFVRNPSEVAEFYESPTDAELRAAAAGASNSAPDNRGALERRTDRGSESTFGRRDGPALSGPTSAALAAFTSKFNEPIEKLKETPHDVPFELPPSEYKF